MDDDLTIDAEVANELAAKLTSADLSGTARVPYPAMTSLTGTRVGATLGNSLKGIFESLNEVIADKANNLTEIVQVMVQTDADLAQGF